MVSISSVRPVRLVMELGQRSRAAWGSLWRRRIRARNLGSGTHRSSGQSSESSKVPGAASYGLVEPFDIDGKQLRGLTPQLCFCLGAEFVMFRNRLMASDIPFTDLCLAANAERMSAMAARHGRFCEIGPPDDGWCTVRIGGHVV